MLEVACHCTNARRAARSLTEHYDAVLAPSGLKVTQFSLLRATGRLGRPSISALAAATGLDRSTLGRNLRVLERAGHVRLGPGRDERTRLVEITEAGAAAVTAALPPWERTQAAITASVGAADLEVFGRVLRRLQELSPQVDEETPT
ncbi:MAG: MarR family winged helix-turn-helix transcriptional regulator [Geminicoccaceae bacterium]